MDIPSELRAIAQAQDGIITRRQALKHGLSKSAIRHALGAGGQWKKIIPGVYACRGYGMQYVPRHPSATLELLVPAHVRRAPISIAKIRRVKTLPAARSVRGIPCAPPERAALDACRDVKNLRDVRAVCAKSSSASSLRWNVSWPSSAT